MDRPISKSEQNKGNWKKYLLPVLILAGLIGAFYGLRGLLKKKVDFSALYIVQVERGDMQNTLTASGTIVPMYERQINAPVATEIAEVYLRSGTEVKKGDLILKLDQEYTRLEYEKLDDALELKKNNIDKLKLQYDKDLIELDYRDQIKALELSKQEAQVSDQKKLHEVGGATAEEVEQAELALKVGRLEKKILENELAYKKSVNVSEKRNLELEYQIQRKSLQELRRKLTETKVVANQAGVITWINEDIGRTVNQGEPLVRIADLSQFRVEARCSDRYTQKILVGQSVLVKIDKQVLTGKVERIQPEVLNNTIRFLVTLDEQDDTRLRANMQTEVFIVTDQQKDVLKLKKGSAILGANDQDVFVVKNGMAYRTPITKGLSNSTHVEIVSGLELGDQVIISDTKEFKHLDQFSVLNK
jgi:HlyD family secretion protein